jgi:WS/DGAT/MGAT family acyltransferase
MERLNLLDAIFLLLETAESPKHVGVLLVFDRPEDAPPDFVADLVARFRTLRPQAPFDRRPRSHLLGQLSWETVEQPDLDYHVRHVALPSSIDEHGVLEYVARMHEPLLDREMPLWEIHFIEGLPAHRFAIYVKIHHACVDGVSGMQRIQASLHDDPSDRTLRVPWGALPGDGRPHERRQASMLARLGDVAGALRDHLRAGSELSVAALQRGLELAGLSAGGHYLPFSAPRTAINKTIHRARSIAVQTLDAPRMIDFAHAHRVTINDVVLTIIDRALHRYLRDHAGDTGAPLIAMVPMSLREDGDTRSNTQACLLYIELGREHATPEQRLRQVHAASEQAKTEAREYSPTALSDHSMLVIGLAELIGRLPLGDRLRPAGNVLVSNVPGSDQRLFLHGAPLRGAYPLSTLMPGCALNVTLMRHGDQIDFGFVSSRDAIPDIAALARYVGEAFEEMTATFDAAAR